LRAAAVGADVREQIGGLVERVGAVLQSPLDVRAPALQGVHGVVEERAELDRVFGFSADRNWSISTGWSVCSSGIVAPAGNTGPVPLLIAM